MQEHRLLFIAISLVYVCNYKVDSVDTVSHDENKGEIREELDIKDAQRHLKSDPKAVKMDVVGLANGVGGHGHGHLHHPNKVSRYFYRIQNTMYVRLISFVFYKFE